MMKKLEEKKGKCYLYFSHEDPEYVYLTRDGSIEERTKHSNYFAFEIEEIQPGKQSLISNNDENMMAVAENTTPEDYKKHLIDAFKNANPDEDGFKNVGEAFFPFISAIKEEEGGLYDDSDDYIGETIEEYVDHLVDEWLHKTEVDGDSASQYRWYSAENISDGTIFDDDDKAIKE